MLDKFFIRLYRKLYYTVKKILNTIYYIPKLNDNLLLINSWTEQWFGNLSHRNFGDELNNYLLEELTDYKVVNALNTFLSGKKYLVIGSIIEEYSSTGCVVWGSGTIEGFPRKLKCIPSKITAVRGKLTRSYLINNGIECPEVYGDPALLLPLVYKPNVQKKSKYGLIPHVVDLNNPLISTFINHYKDQVCLISFRDYDDWHNVINQICSCDAIISSSLHGLIISDAYAIPNVWITVSDKIEGGLYKFKDYFSGVDRNFSMPYQLNLKTTLIDIDNELDKYKAIDVDLKALLNACPFKLRKNFL